MKNILKLVRCSGLLFVMLFLFITTNSLHAQWIQTKGASEIGSIVSLMASPGELFAGTDRGGVFRFTSSDTNWIAVNSGLPDYTTAYSLAANEDGTNLFVGTHNAGVFTSANNGASWTANDSGLAYGWVLSLKVLGGNVFAGTYDQGIFISSISFTKWTAINSGVPTVSEGSPYYLGIEAFAVCPNGLADNLFAATFGGGVLLSSNNGSSWTTVNSGLTDTSVYCLATSPNGTGGTNIFAGTLRGGVFLFTDNGTSWTAANSGLPESKAVYSLKASQKAGGGTNLFAAINNQGIFLSTDNGANWNPVNTGLTNSSVYALAVFGTNLFAGTSSGVWMRPMSEMTTGVADNDNQLPGDFMLKQNYPNPFNPATNIEFQIANRGFASLKVFDLLGREVVTIVSEELPAGSYKKQWNAENLSSGIYYYRLQSGTYIETKKMILLR